MKRLPDLIKSPNDKLNYKAFELENKLSVILIFDKEAK